MRMLTLLALSLALAGCGGQAANNAVNAVNIVAEEGVEDVNSSIEGDQLAPNPEATDDLAGNRSAPSPLPLINTASPAR